jgi:hypothetical protein
MVRQHDPDWGDQHGKPQDPQAGNMPGNQRDFRPHLADPIPTTAELASSFSGTRYVEEPAAAMAAFNGLSFAVFDPLTGLAGGTAQTSSEPDELAPASSASIDWSGNYLASTQAPASRSTSGSNASGIVLPDYLFAPLTLPSSPSA